MKHSNSQFSLISYIKGRNPTIAGLRRVWAKETALSIEDVSIADVLYQLIDIIERSGTVNLAKFISDLGVADPVAWFGFPGEFGGDMEKYVRVLASRIRLTEVKYFPGYYEYEKERP